MKQITRGSSVPRVRVPLQKKCVEYAEKLQEDDSLKECVRDETIQKFVINLQDDSDSSFSESEEMIYKESIVQSKFFVWKGVLTRNICQKSKVKTGEEEYRAFRSTRHDSLRMDRIFSRAKWERSLLSKERSGNTADVFLRTDRSSSTLKREARSKNKRGSSEVSDLNALVELTKMCRPMIHQSLHHLLSRRLKRLTVVQVKTWEAKGSQSKEEEKSCSGFSYFFTEFRID
ncbi:hypothetical protein NPIL_43971 [Nephila pilipes]|uniref:Uncharacterized protein n=1 Tax=Nephila pilipes TaxID=299642 RepID=A0A8X6IQJ7_NEPPI|nr:hypothetical protein NPIL_43971 [Nephila pilipes]